MAHTLINWRMACLFVAFATGLAVSGAAEIRLRTQCETSAAVLTLGELAEILSSDPAETSRLAAIELGPAPPPGQQRFVRVREIQDALWAQRVNLLEHQFSGYGLIAVTRAVEQPPRPIVEKARPVVDKDSSTSNTRKATEQVQQALAGYLRSRGAEAGKIEFQLSDPQVRAVLASGKALSFSGGMPPWTRQQRLELILGGPESESRSPLDVRVSSSVAVVVPLRTLPRGAVVRPEDVQVTQTTFATAAPRELPSSLEEVVGRETTRALPEGKPLSSDALRTPILVRRGDMVTVVAQAPGVKVKSVARARDDAGLGQPITLESIPDRKTLLARVTGPQEAEVSASSAPPNADRSAGRSHRAAGSQHERNTR